MYLNDKFALNRLRIFFIIYKTAEPAFLYFIDLTIGIKIYILSCFLIYKSEKYVESLSC